MKFYSCLSKDFYWTYYHLPRILSVSLAFISLGMIAWHVTDWRDSSLPLVICFLCLLGTSIFCFRPTHGKWYGKKIAFENGQISIYTHKKKFLKIIHTDEYMLIKKTICFPYYRSGIIERDCLVLYRDPNVFEKNPRLFITALHKSEDTFVIQNPEVLALLEQIFAVEKK